MTTDFKSPPPTRIKGALAAIHRERGETAECALNYCWERRDQREPLALSLHHVYDRSDVWENLVFLCGDGVRGCHGAITANNELARTLLGEHLAEHRPDTIAYILAHKGGKDWLRRRLFLKL